MTIKLNLKQIEIVNDMIAKNAPITHIASRLGLNYKTIRRILKNDFNGYNGNQSGKGYSKVKSNKASLNDYLNNKVKITSYKLKLKLFDNNIKLKKCEDCGITKWMGKDAPLELHHVDGNPSNNNLKNLKILCPNCHALSENYRIRKKKN